MAARGFSAVGRDLAGALRSAAQMGLVESYPLTKYATDPVLYAEERLGLVLMPHQRAILDALANGIAGKVNPETGRRFADRVAVRSGQKCGKTKLAIAAALWFYECFDGARVFMCAAIIEQTKSVLWRELGQTLRDAKKTFCRACEATAVSSGRCVKCGSRDVRIGVEIDGKLAQSPMGGLNSSDGSREIVGKSGREIEALAGLSGRMLTIIDEASALPEGKSQAFHGNTMGGGALLLISNPTRTEGPFYEAFTKHKEHWQTFHIDAEKVAKWQAETGVRVPYVASIERIDEFRAMFGEDSPFWAVRVKGEWLRHETGRIIPMGTIDAARARWDAGAIEEGQLTIGYDPAGPGDGGDEHAWAIVRGNKCVAIFRRRGLNEEKALVATYEYLKQYRKPGESPRVLIDAEGPIGSALYGRLRGESEHRLLHDSAGFFEVSGIKSGSKHVREPQKFLRTRDELAWNLAQWMTTGAIPNDPKLQAELYAPTWDSIASGQIVATPKAKLRDLLNRSPDSFDALALAVWKTLAWGAAEAANELAASPAVDAFASAPTRGGALDPWAALDVWRER